MPNLLTVTATMTEDLYEINGTMVRRWRGRTAKGLDVDLLVQSIRPIDDSGIKPLEEELGVFLKPSPPDKPMEEWSRAEWLHHTGTEGPYGG